MIIFDVSTAFKDLEETMTLFPGTHGSYVDGRWTPDISLDRKIMAHAQPLTNRELDLIPELYRDKQLLKFYCRDTLLQPESKEEQRGADFVLYGDDKYKIIMVKDWQQIGGYYVSIGAKVDK